MGLAENGGVSKISLLLDLLIAKTCTVRYVRILYCFVFIYMNKFIDFAL